MTQPFPHVPFPTSVPQRDVGQDGSPARTTTADCQRAGEFVYDREKSLAEAKARMAKRRGQRSNGYVFNPW